MEVRPIDRDSGHAKREHYRSRRTVGTHFCTGRDGDTLAATLLLDTFGLVLSLSTKL